MLGDRNTFRPASVEIDGARSLEGDPEDRAQAWFGNWIDEPTLIASYDVDKLPRFPIAVEVKASGGLRVESLHGVRVAIGWDGAETFDAKPIAIKAGRSASLEVSSPKGRRLEVWADATNPIESDSSEIESVQVLSLADARERERERADAPPVLDPKDPLGLGGLGIGLAVVGLLGLAIWFGFGRGAAA